MATVTTNPVPVITYHPYAGVPDILAELSSIPRGHIDVSVEQGAIALSGAGDNQLVVLSVSLPANFAYALVNLSMSIRANSGSLLVDFNDDASFRWENGSGTARTIVDDVAMTANGVSTMASAPLGLKIWSHGALPNYVMSPANSSAQVGFTAHVFNPNVEDQAYLFNFYAKFLQFDIEQTLHYAPNAPIPVR